MRIFDPVAMSYYKKNSSDESVREEAFKDGQKAEYDRFWDAYQMNGTRRSYSRMFSDGWNDDIFRPKYDMILGGYCRDMFFQSGITDMVAALERSNVLFDSSKAMYVENMFSASAITRIPEISLVSIAHITAANYLFASCEKLVEVKKLILNDAGTTAFTGMFNYCKKLTSISFEGVIGENIDFRWSPLSADSIMSVITHLSDSADGKTATFMLSAVNNAFETAEGAADGSTSQAWRDLVATKTNWSISIV